MKSYDGVVMANTFDVRFAYSGKVVSIRKRTGDRVKAWETLASLDRKVMQMELDRQLADYEKVRAEFELFTLKYGDGGDDTIKFLRQEKQATLNASVKDVELAKYRLDQADLVSPVDGIIVSTDGLYAGIYVTPSSHPVTVLDTNSMYVAYDISQDELPHYTQSVSVAIRAVGSTQEYVGNTSVIQNTKPGIFSIRVDLAAPGELRPGMRCTVTANVTPQ